MQRSSRKCFLFTAGTFLLNNFCSHSKFTRVNAGERRTGFHWRASVTSGAQPTPATATSRNEFWVRRLASRPLSRNAVGEAALLCLRQEGRHHFSFYRPTGTHKSHSLLAAAPKDFQNLLRALVMHKSPENIKWIKQISLLFFDLLNKPVHPQRGAMSAWDLAPSDVVTIKQTIVCTVMDGLEGVEALQWLLQTLGLEVRNEFGKLQRNTALLPSSVESCEGNEEPEALAVVSHALLFTRTSSEYAVQSTKRSSHRPNVVFTDPHGERIFYSAATIPLTTAALLQVGTSSSKATALEVLEVAARARLMDAGHQRFSGGPPLDVSAVVVHCAEVAAQQGDPELVTRLMFLLCRSEGALGRQTPVEEKTSADEASRSSSCSNSRAPSFTEQVTGLVWWGWHRLGRAVRWEPQRGPTVRDQRATERDEELTSFTARLLKSAIHASLHRPPQRGAPPDLERLGEALGLFSSLAKSSSWSGVAAMAVELLTYMASLQQRLFLDSVTDGASNVLPFAAAAETADGSGAEGNEMERLGRSAVYVFVVLRSQWLAEVNIPSEGQKTILMTCAELLFRTLIGVAPLPVLKKGVRTGEIAVMCFPFEISMRNSWKGTKCVSSDDALQEKKDVPAMMSEILQFLVHYGCCPNSKTTPAFPAFARVLPYVLLSFSQQALRCLEQNRPFHHCSTLSSLDGPEATRAAPAENRLAAHFSMSSPTIALPNWLDDPEAFLTSPIDVSATNNETAASTSVGGLLLYGGLCDAAAARSRSHPWRSDSVHPRSKLCRWLTLAHREWRLQLWTLLLCQPSSVWHDAQWSLEQLVVSLYESLDEVLSDFFSVDKTRHTDPEAVHTAALESRREALLLLDTLYHLGCSPEKRRIAVVDRVYGYALHSTVFVTSFEELAPSCRAGPVVVVTAGALRVLAQPTPPLSLHSVVEAVQSPSPLPRPVTFALTKNAVRFLFSSETSCPLLGDLKCRLLNGERSCAAAPLLRVVALPPLDRGCAPRGGTRVAAPEGVREALQAASLRLEREGGAGRGTVWWWSVTPAAEEEVFGSEWRRCGARVFSIRRALMNRAKNDIRALCSPSAGHKPLSGRDAALSITAKRRVFEARGCSTESLLKTLSMGRKKRG